MTVGCEVHTVSHGEYFEHFYGVYLGKLWINLSLKMGIQGGIFCLGLILLKVGYAIRVHRESLTCF